ncbi:alanine racemase [Gordonia sp. 852002-10350_SCH5691597]|uniref:alanine racemase n=1 Tax=Gordonia sp. 852002-10350_SCH5691597 TaxID=1834085 RepID=UPI0007EBC8A9|nr:alanine racemase [Gordonia sp. 852002-10350_SCH5691597]OBA68495.1 alanine racemase [Gordonia sp. 852002-10350_SCH5691597]
MTDTPYLAVDLARLDRNLQAVAELARNAHVDLRPHAKTHKTAELARRQIDSGAVGLTVATIGEAEAFAAAGFGDLFIAYPLWVTAHKGARLRALADRVSLRLAVDSVEGAVRLAAELSGAEVLVEVDSGQHRTGVAPESAGEVAAAAQSAGLKVVGVFTFPGHGYGPGHARRDAAAQEIAALSSAAEQLRDRGIEPRVRSGGSTPTIEFADSGVLTEIRPGVYPFYDAQQVELGVCGFDDVALTAVSTVVRRDGRRVVLDAGSKIIGADRPAWASGHGRILDEPAARIVALSEHHAVVEYPDEYVPSLGSTVRVVPNHVCTAVNLVDELVVGGGAGEGGEGEVATWRVVARGANS